MRGLVEGLPLSGSEPRRCGQRAWRFLEPTDELRAVGTRRHL